MVAKAWWHPTANRALHGRRLGQFSRRSAFDRGKTGRGTVSRKSKKKTRVVHSFAEAEYVALFQVAKESMWMVGFLEDLGVAIQDAMMVNVDNQESIALAPDPVFVRSI